MMSESFELIDHEQYTEIVLHGDLTQEIRKNVLMFMPTYKGRDCGPKFLINLLDTNFDPDEPMTGAVELVHLMVKIGYDKTYVLAFLARGAEQHRKFYEDVAKIEELNIRYFSDRKSAEAYVTTRTA